MKKYLELFKKLEMLKRTEREGWKRFGIEDPESVSDHSFRAAFMALVLAEKFNLDGFKLVKLLLVHDLAESETGDITPETPVSEEEKFVKEEKVIEDISRSFESDLDINELWKEFESGDTREAIIARDIDRLERILQALEYEEENPEKDLSEFFVDGESELESKEIRKFLKQILDETLKSKKR